ncbi:MAG TPA: RNA polymerase subunit sigma-24 [Thermoanaerobaculia bacterium]|nr:RNA polymerase subunit sigma-24 [Thermoanaerobaculia bacterium]
MRSIVLVAALLLGAIVPGSIAGQEEGHSLAMSGGDLSEEAVQKLERQLESAPDDAETRSRLLGYYFLHSRAFGEARKARQQHILWLIRNRPEAPILETPFAHLDAILESSAYAEGKKAWLAQVDRQPKNTAILGHAAAYSLLHDMETAESLYRRAEAAEPQDPKWPERLGHLHALGLSAKSGAARQKAAKASLDAFERSLQRTTDGEERESLLTQVASVALEAGEVAKARGYAEEIIGKTGSGNWNDGDMLHQGNLVLGRIALRNGDVTKAKEHLLAAGKVSGSPVLGSFGPNMRLAKELLEKGEREVVLEYFRLCGSFWKKDELKVWAKEVRAGKIPEFGGNLEY